MICRIGENAPPVFWMLPGTAGAADGFWRKWRGISGGSDDLAIVSAPDLRPHRLDLPAKGPRVSLGCLRGAFLAGGPANQPSLRFGGVFEPECHGLLEPVDVLQRPLLVLPTAQASAVEK